MTLIAAIIVPLLAGSAVLQSPTPEELRWLESVSRASTPEERARLASREPDRIKPASLVRLASALRKASPRERGKWIEAGRGLLLIAEIGRDVEAHAHALWASARLAASPFSGTPIEMNRPGQVALIRSISSATPGASASSIIRLCRTSPA